MDGTQTTLRDALSNAIDAHEAGETENVQQDNVVSEQPSTERTDKTRDEQGRFAKQAEPEVKTEVVAEVTAKPRPSSWRKDYEEHWTKLDPALQDYINKRESDYANGVSQYKQNYEAVAPIYEAMQPFMPLLQQHNMQPQQWISNLGNAHRTLVEGSPEAKLQAFAKLASDYGVPLQALTGQQYDPQQAQLMTQFNQMQNQLNGFLQMQEQEKTTALERQIEEFKQSAPHFDEVKETMAQLLQSGAASDLKSAYDKAIRLNDDLWNQQQAAAQQAKAQADTQEAIRKAAEAKAKTVSTGSKSPTATTASGNSKDRRSIIADALEEVSGGRV